MVVIYILIAVKWAMKLVFKSWGDVRYTVCT